MLVGQGLRSFFRRPIRSPLAQRGINFHAPSSTSRGAGLKAASAFSVLTVFKLTNNGKSAASHNRVICAKWGKLKVAFE
jgi:hypothetical protein